MDDDTPSSGGIPVADVKAASSAMLQKQLYVIRTEPTGGIGPVLANLEPHLDFQVGLERDGALFAAGPLWSSDERTWHGEGMLVVRAASLEDAEKIAARDPMHECGARRYTVTPWMINEGGARVRLNFSSQTFEIE